MKKIIAGSHLVKAALIGTMAVATLSVVGCATKPTYQAASQAGPKITTNAQGVPNYHRVQRGDTVSQIATRYRLSYRQIGAMNNLDSKYTIHSGQWLKLWQGSAAPQSQPTYTPPATQSQTPAYEVTANSTSGYEYPTSNKVTRNIDPAAGNMGMWFAGNVGDPVLASQSGTVLYSGNGLSEYGNLIMIRHSDNYITAYAHNSQLLVKEGDAVQRGQRIANMGSSGQTNQVGLEFQVRLNGNPIDPRSVLGR
ncbi:MULTISPECIES: peptidoglycan DD-metalloendopeptidase family protein [unclassified Psychrobacter]|uniref:peptidoglycan DD-metalloendopeptidase family protein n=1 Tax=unclassified Psychrobacter TaxID=196806 RepID=UPI0025B45C32|nr:MULTISPECIES: peptidoglycan DD-metalloendopeptidase family protein [unclassified Psychrobacter]MDN3453990.1 peptidoglycan DD-metalloendopeptidase family protein [Psychrobacter sp. APC 3350]MDN3501305.1 peptidoglycan DD-metalloendopeptidase family protein [Psychrobacter sp. 5A.1]